MRKTKIICTLGPAVESDEMVKALIQNGMDAARLNFSHGTHDEHRARIERVRRVAQEMGVNIPVILDTKGPEIRTREFAEGTVVLKEGSTFTLYASKEQEGNENGVSITYPYLAEEVEKGTSILIDDGLCSLTVIGINGPDVICRVNNTSKVSNHKSINIPGVDIDQPFISETDRADLLFGIEMDVDYISASFVRTADDVKKMRKLLNVNGGEKIKIIAKIECRSGIDNLDEIIKVADGIMVARGDMGVEIPFKELPVIQKMMIDKCVKAGKIVVTATQMLESMTEHSRPTRAEVSDVANAIFDGTTCTMLSGETAAGKYPIEAVKTMADIAEFTENQIDYRSRYFATQACETSLDIPGTISNAAVEASFSLGAKAIICMTATGRTGWLTSSCRPESPIIVCVTDEKAARQLNLAYGVKPLLAPFTEDVVKMREQSIELALSSKEVEKDDLAVIISGSIPGFSYADSMQISRI
ncbi:MAG: pyruvate kinase [Spirochaetes bacterium]|uniref:Pyruvate kinase n=1 Tax=Candidatus Ornithospirochaeta stercoripullorum TaxID=2840899 RepID=A0A9D9DYL1_9SPIO|nr:pyruvate kinase [Candidatus Ornithospirochaeta stercoripullorum]